MVISYYRPISNYLNGIIKANYINNKTNNIIVEASSISPNFANIYLSAILEDNDSVYFQSYVGNEDPIINITFEKHVFITQFSLKTKISGNEPWMYPKNYTLKGCNGDKCRLIANNSNPNYFKQTEPILTAVSPGVYHTFSFQAQRTKLSDNAIFYAINRIEFFGYTCDSNSECNGNIILKTFCFKKNFIQCDNILIALVLFS